MPTAPAQAGRGKTMLPLALWSECSEDNDRGPASKWLTTLIGRVYLPLRTRLCANGRRAYIAHIGLYVLTILAAIVGTVSSRFVRDPCEHLLWLFGRLYAPVCRAYLRHVGGITFRVVGEAPDSTRPILVVATHRTELDLLVPWFADFFNGRPLHLAKDSLMKLPCFGTCLRKAGAVSVARGSVGKDFVREYKRALTRKDRTIILFPEGTRTPPSEPVLLQPGSARLVKWAVRAGFQVIPVGMNTWPAWGEKGRLHTGRPHECLITVGPLLAIDPNTKDEHVLDEMTDALEQVRYPER